MYLQSIKSVKHNAAKSVNRSILKKSRHVGFGVFIVHSSMPPPLVPLRIPHNIIHTSQPLYGSRTMRDGEGGEGVGLLVFCPGQRRIRLVEVNAKSLRLKSNMEKGRPNCFRSCILCIRSV
jgi:hypothetical protein